MIAPSDKAEAKAELVKHQKHLDFCEYGTPEYDKTYSLIIAAKRHCVRIAYLKQSVIRKEKLSGCYEQKLNG